MKNAVKAIQIIRKISNTQEKKHNITITICNLLSIMNSQ